MSGTVRPPPSRAALGGTLPIEPPSFDDQPTGAYAPASSRRRHQLSEEDARTHFQEPEVQSAAFAPLGPVSGVGVHGEPIAADAPEWMRLGRIVSSEIERAIARGTADLATRSAISRAWAAWQLGGYSARQIATVARLVEAAHRTLLGRPVTHEALAASAAILRRGLPTDMRDYTTEERLVEVLLAVTAIPNPHDARVLGASRLLGWSDAARAWASEAIAVAMGEAE